MSASKKMEARGGTIRRVLQLIAPYRLLVVLSLALAAVTVVATLYAPVLTGRGVDMILGPGAVDFAGLGRLGIQLCLVVFATALCQWLMNVINNRITFQVVRDIRVKAFSHMEQLPLKYIDAHRPGEAISRLTTDVEQFSDGLLMGFTQLFTGVLTILVTLGFMLSIDWRITLVVVVLTPLSFFVARFIAQHTYSMFRVQSETRAEMTGLVEELVGNEHLVRAFGYESRAEKVFHMLFAADESCHQLGDIEHAAAAHAKHAVGAKSLGFGQDVLEIRYGRLGLDVILHTDGHTGLFQLGNNLPLHHGLDGRGGKQEQTFISQCDVVSTKLRRATRTEDNLLRL